MESKEKIVSRVAEKHYGDLFHRIQRVQRFQEGVTKTLNAAEAEVNKDWKPIMGFVVRKSSMTLATVVLVELWTKSWLLSVYE